MAKWGSNTYQKPAKIASNVKTVETAFGTIVFSDTSNNLYFWGKNANQWYVESKSGFIATPVKIASNVKTFYNYYFIMYLTQNGELKAVGPNYNNMNISSVIPAKHNVILSNVSNFHVNANESVIATAKNGAVYVWGTNSYQITENGGPCFNILKPAKIN
jgi:hypothetical protein